MDKKVRRRLNKIVRDNYDAVGEEFSQTRQKAWAEFEVYKELCRRGARVLDIGCGNGRLYWQALKEREVKYLGVDPSKAMLKEAKKPKAELSAAAKRKVQFKDGNLTKIPAKALQFDVVFCIAAFHHLPGKEDREKSLRELRRVAKEDGYIVISVWNLYQKRFRKYVWQALWRSLKTLGKYAWNDTLFKWKGKGALRYYHAFTIWEMRALLRSNGLRIVQELFPDGQSMEAGLASAHNYVFICKK